MILFDFSHFTVQFSHFRCRLHQEPPAIAAALAAAPRFGLHATAARAILREVFTAVSGWRHAGKALRIKASTLDAYATAFDNPLMAEAGKHA